MQIARKNNTSNCSNSSSRSKKSTYDVVVEANLREVFTVKATATLPTNYNVFQSYKFQFNGTLGDDYYHQINITDNTVKVMCGDQDVTGYFHFDYQDNSFTCSIENLKNVCYDPDAQITLTFQAYINESAVQGQDGNPIITSITYSADPTKPEDTQN